MTLSLVVVLVLAQAEDVAAGGVDAGIEVQRETTVTAARVVDVRRVAGSAQVIGQEELTRQKATDVHKVLQSVPGVYVREEDGFGLRPNIGLRGVNADRSAKVALLEDGIPFAPAPYSAPEAYYFPLVGRMAAVEVFKGPASIRYGPQTIGGAINFVTKPVPQQLEADLDLSLGNYGAGKVQGSVGWGTERLGVLVQGTHLQSDGFKQLDGGGNTGFAKNEVMLKARYATDPSAQVRQVFAVKGSFSTEQSHESYLGISPEDFAATPQRRYAATQRDEMNWWRTQAELTHTLQVSNWFEVTTTAYRHDFDRTWFRANGFRQGPDLYTLLAYPAAGSRWRAILAGEVDSSSPNEAIVDLKNHRTFVAQGLQSIARAKVTTGPLAHEVELGARFHHDMIHRDHAEYGFNMVSGTLVPDGTAPEQVADNVAFTRAFSVHLTDTISWGHLLVAPGVRTEVMGLGWNDRLQGGTLESTQVVPLLGVGAVYAFEQLGLSVLAGVHQGFSPVAPGQSPEVKAERAVNSEAGLRFSRAGVRAEVIGFWSEYSNLTGECTGSTGCTGDQVNVQFNGGKARVLGLEALAAVRRRLGWGVTFGLDATYTFTSAHFLSDFTSENAIWGNVTAGDELPYIPQHQGLVRVRASKGPVEIGFGAGGVTDAREVAGHGSISDAVKIPAHVLLDATVAVEIDGARFYATGTNLTNQSVLVSRRPFGARPTAPFMFQVGFSYAFR